MSSGPIITLHESQWTPILQNTDGLKDMDCSRDLIFHFLIRGILGKRKEKEVFK